MTVAEYDDVTIERNFAGKITALIFNQYDNVNIQATGTLRTQSGSAWTNIGATGDIIIDNETAGQGVYSGTNGDQQLRMKATGEITALNGNNIAISAQNAILEADGGTLGSINLGNGETSPLLINLSGNSADTGWITARSRDGISISFVDAQNNPSTAWVREIGARDGDVSLTATSFVNALPSITNAKIGGVNILLTATAGDIGSADYWLGIFQHDGGSVDLSAAGGIFVNNPTSSFNIVGLNAGTQAEINAVGDILLSGIFNTGQNASLTSGGNITTDSLVMAISNVLTATAGTDLTFSNGTVINAKSANLTATLGEILFDDSTLTISSLLSVIANTDITLIDSNIKAASASLTATTGQILLDNSTITATNALKLTAYTDITVMNSSMLRSRSTTLTATTGAIYCDDSSIIIGAISNVQSIHDNQWSIWHNRTLSVNNLRDVTSFDQTIFDVLSGSVFSEDEDEEETEELGPVIVPLTSLVPAVDSLYAF
jgi:hypothetical protein